jgi:hypothetical protein
MAIVREQFKVDQGSGSQNGADIAFDSSVTAGSLLLMAVSVYQAGGTPSYTVADNNGNSWVEIADNNYDGSDLAGFAYALNANSGATTVTVTTAGAGDFHTIVIVEVSGIETTGALDQNNTNTATSASWDSGNITTTQADEYLFGAFAHDNGNRTLTEDGAWTLIFEEQNGTTDMPISVGERIVSSTLTESYSGTIAVSSPYWAGIASFKGTGGAPSASIPVIMHHYRQQGMT